MGSTKGKRKMIYSEEEARKLTGDQLLYEYKWSGYDTKLLCEAELRRRLKEWEERNADGEILREHNNRSIV